MSTEPTAAASELAFLYVDCEIPAGMSVAAWHAQTHLRRSRRHRLLGAVTSWADRSVSVVASTKSSSSDVPPLRETASSSTSDQTC